MRFIANREPLFKTNREDLWCYKLLNILTFKKSRWIKRRLHETTREFESIQRRDVY